MEKETVEIPKVLYLALLDIGGHTNKREVESDIRYIIVQALCNLLEDHKEWREIICYWLNEYYDVEEEKDGNGHVERAGGLKGRLDPDQGTKDSTDSDQMYL